MGLLRRRQDALGSPSGPADHRVEPLRALDPVERLLAIAGDDPSITEILVNGPGPIWIERAGRIECTATEMDRHGLELLIEAVVAPLGLRVDRSSPIVDARLTDGSRVNIVVPPLAIGGPAISIRRFPRRSLSLDRFGPPSLATVLGELVAERASVLVVGPTSSGKTSLVAALAALTEPRDRIVAIEDTAELPLARSNLVRLEARPANSEGVGQVSVRQLVLAALRMRPDRLIVGEVRGAEAFDLLLALTSGHRGCLTTCHAPDAGGGLRRLELLAAMAGTGLDTGRLRQLVLDGLDAVVVTGRSGPFRGVGAVVMVDAGRLVVRWSLDRSGGGRRTAGGGSAVGDRVAA